MPEPADCKYGSGVAAVWQTALQDRLVLIAIASVNSAYVVELLAASGNCGAAHWLYPTLDGDKNLNIQKITVLEQSPIPLS